MKRFMPGAFAAAFILGSMAACPGQDIARKASGGTDTVTPGDLKADLSPAQYARIVKPIETRMAMAAKAMEPYEKEMQKPEAKRRQALLIACKEQAASHYFAASASARRGIPLVRKDSLKAALKEQYEEPNKQKAIDLYLELALDAHTGGDLRRAVGYYRQILAIDPENAQAKNALLKLAEQYRQAMKDARKPGGKGGGSDEDHSGYGYSRDWSSVGRFGF